MPPTQRPEIDLQAAETHARRWGLGGPVRELDSYADRNFVIGGLGGTRHVLKFAAIDESRAALELQTEVLTQLAGQPSATRVPRLRPALDGRSLLDLRDALGRPCTARALTWIEGGLWSELSTAERTPALRRDLGAALARLDRDLADFEGPTTAGARGPAFRWNLARAEWIEDELPALEATPPLDRALIVDTLTRYRAHVQPRLDDLPWQLIHGDANDQNLVVDGGEVQGIFDFGDLCLAPAVCDLAIALAYAAMGGPDQPVLTTERSLAACAEVSAGYHRVRPLVPLAQVLLYDLLCMRLCVSVTSSAVARRLEPANTYLGWSELAAWGLLRSLSQIGRGPFTAAIERTCASQV